MSLTTPEPRDSLRLRRVLDVASTSAEQAACANAPRLAGEWTRVAHDAANALERLLMLEKRGVEVELVREQLREAMA